MSKEKSEIMKVKRKHKDTENKSMSNLWRNVSGQSEEVKLIDINDLVSNDNPYPLSKLEELIESIKQFGVEQALLVQEQENGKYLIVAGHRRYNAVKYILENENSKNEYDELEDLYCKVIDKKEDETLVRIRLHETNLQARPLNKMSDEEKNKIVNEYLELIAEAREKKLLIKGKEVKGKTRDILADMLGISGGNAQELIKKSKGTNFGTHTKSDEELKEKQQQKLIKELKKTIDKDYLDKKTVVEMNIMIKEYNDKLKNKVDPNQIKIDSLVSNSE